MGVYIQLGLHPSGVGSTCGGVCLQGWGSASSDPHPGESAYRGSAFGGWEEPPGLLTGGLGRPP